MLRRPGIAAVLTASTVGPLSSCDGSPAKDTESDLLTGPTLESCRMLDVGDLAAASNHSAIVDCAQPHTAQSWSWFRPSEKGWKRGARWYRCDVVGGPAEATELRELPVDANGLFSTDYPDAWMTCARGETAEQGNKVACDAAHDWRAVTSVKLGEPGSAYPGDRIAEVRSRDYCRDSVRGWLGYPPDFDFGYTYYRQDRWDGGNRRAICWARTTK